jgi:hypothetical protein
MSFYLLLMKGQSGFRDILGNYYMNNLHVFLTLILTKCLINNQCQPLKIGIVKYKIADPRKMLKLSSSRVPTVS